MKKLWKWTKARLRDLFYGVGNQSLDLARVIAGVMSGLAVFAFYWNAIVLGEAIPLGDTFTGLSLLVGAIWVGVAAKDYVRSQYNNEGEQNENIADK